MAGLELGRSEPSICIGCGLCCDGTLLSHLAVRDQSDLGAPLAALGVEVEAAFDPPAFELPCPAFDGRCCSVFDHHRPSACGQFECRLSQAVADGEVSLHDARGVVRHTRVLRDRVRAGLAPEPDLEAVLDRHFRRGPTSSS